MKQARTQALYSYWRDLCGERSAPERDEIDPAAIPAVLADVFMLEVDEARRFPIRLAGARLNALFARELKGGAFIDLFDAGEQSMARALIGAVLDDALPAVAGVATGPAGWDAIECELLLLPLRYRGRTHARILGALTPARLPSWIGLLPVERIRLVSLRLIHPNAEEFAAAPVCGGVSTEAPRRHGRFVVYEGRSDI